MMYASWSGGWASVWGSEVRVSNTRIYVRLFGLFQIESHSHTHTGTLSGLYWVVVLAAPGDPWPAPTVDAVVWTSRPQTRSYPELPGFYFSLQLTFLQHSHSIWILKHTRTHICHYSLCSLRSHLARQYGFGSPCGQACVPVPIFPAFPAHSRVLILNVYGYFIAAIRVIGLRSGSCRSWLVVC